MLFRSWQRVDPTALAVPIRVDSGIAAAVPQGASLPLLMRSDSELLRSLRFNWSALANKWNQWILGYNQDRQRDFLAYFGVQSPDWRALTMMMFWSVAGVVLLVALWLLGRWRREDPVQRAWNTFCKKLASAGVERTPSEGPREFETRACSQLPGASNAISRVVDLYVELRYGRPASPERFIFLKRELRNRVQGMRP